MSNDEDVGRDVARDLDGRVARKPGVGHGVLNGLAQVDELLLLMAVTRVGEELVDDVLHLLKVAHHGGAGVLGQVGELDLEAQARDRRAKVVAHARERSSSRSASMRRRSCTMRLKLMFTAWISAVPRILQEEDRGPCPDRAARPPARAWRADRSRAG